MERFWTLQHIQRHGITELTCSVIKEGVVRANDLPLVIDVIGTDAMPRNAQVRVKLGTVNLMSLDVTGVVTTRLGDSPQASLSDDGNEDDEDDLAAGPLAIAVDVNEADAPEAAVS